VTVGASDPQVVDARPIDGGILIGIDGMTTSGLVRRDGSRRHVDLDGHAWLIETEDSTASHRIGAGGPGDGIVRSPMPGRVLAVLVAAGDAVTDGQPLAIVEAMKMEHTLRASGDGVAATVHVVAGQQVALDEALITIDHRSEEQT
jgi:acetyl-CoA/propionyl-CoA carboxylase, biotin carboxylase, biotin carboxyl carrier protein